MSPGIRNRERTTGKRLCQKEVEYNVLWHTKQGKYGKLLSDQFKDARIYVSHFLQVLNFCIIRREIKPEVREKFGLSIDDKAVPDMGTEQQLITWGEKVLKGEEQRMMM